MKRWPLGWKLTAWSVGVVVATSGLSLFCTRAYVRAQEMAELDEQLAGEATHFLADFHAAGARLDWVTAPEMARVLPAVRAPDRFFLVTDGRSRVLYQAGNPPVDTFLKAGPGLHMARVGHTPVRLDVVSDGPRLTLYLASDLAEIDGLVAEITHGYFVMLPFILLAAAGGGWWLAQQALRPVKEVADAAGLIRLENLSNRLSGEDRRDEIGRLVRVFNDMLARLERGFQQATRFSADASHELRTPLTVLHCGLEALLREPDLPAAHREAVADLQWQTSSLIALANSLLLLARADAGHLPLDLQDADLAEIVAECLEDARILAEQRGLRVECFDLSVTPVRVDVTRTRQILSNLLDNAVKYNAPGGRVVVRLELAGRWASLRIGNDGAGVPAEAQPELFKRFHRAGQREDQPGAGLGLSLARELARSHGGDVRLAEARPGWTEFELRLPVDQSDSLLE